MDEQASLNRTQIMQALRSAVIVSSARRMAGLSQEELATLCECSAKDIDAIERGAIPRKGAASGLNKLLLKIDKELGSLLTQEQLTKLKNVGVTHENERQKP